MSIGETNQTPYGGDDLIKRLRFNEWLDPILPEAADSIEELEREQSRLHTQCDGLMQAGMNNGQALILAEAKLAKAVESIKQSIKLWEKYDDTELKWDRGYKLDSAYDGFELLCKALVELEGEG